MSALQGHGIIWEFPECLYRSTNASAGHMYIWLHRVAIVIGPAAAGIFRIFSIGLNTLFRLPSMKVPV